MLNSFHLLFNTFQIAEKVQELLEGFIPPDQEFAVFQTQRGKGDVAVFFASDKSCFIKFLDHFGH